jgi:O-antigen/teichoic acid export membrane protein
MLVWSRVEIAFLQRYWASESIAMFTVGLTLASLATQGPLLLTGPLLPHFAQRAGEQDLKGIVSIYGGGTLLLAATLFPLCIGLASITPVVLPLLYGNAFRAAVPTAMVLIAFSALSFGNVGSALLYARERSGFIALGGTLGAALSIASGFIIIPRWGPWGAAWSKAFVQTSMIALGTWYISKRLACPVPLRAIGKVLGAALAAACVSYAIVRVIADVRGVVLAIPAAAITYLVCVKYGRVFQEADLAMALRVVERLPRRMGEGLGTGLNWLYRHDA